jgi:hypothetical protein
VSLLTKFSLFSLCVASVVGIAGCGDDGPVRFAVSGKVSDGGNPVPDGHISFIPAGDAKVLKAVGEVTKGEFNIPRDQGPEESDYTIKVFIGNPVAPAKSEPGTGGGKGSSFIPPNAAEKPAKTYEFDVKVSADSVTFDLDLSKAK